MPGIAAARTDFVNEILGSSPTPRIIHRAPPETSDDVIAGGHVETSTGELAESEQQPVLKLSSHIAGQFYYTASPRKSDVLEAVRKPDNPHDPNAVGLWLHNRQAGHLPRDVAATVAPLMDKGCRAQVVCIRARGNSKQGAPIAIELFEPSRDQEEHPP